jgi:hypothetical protein
MLKSIQLSRAGRNVAAFFEEQNAWVVFAILCLGYTATSFIQDTMILTKDVYYNTLGERLTIDRIDEIISQQEKWRFVTYLIFPLLVATQVFLVALCLNCGTILMNYKISFTSLFKLVLRASTVFLINKLLFTFILLFSKVQVAEDLMILNKFALSGFADKDSVPQWLMYALSVVNVFEIVFWLLLAFGMTRLLQKSLKSSLAFVMATYGLGLLIWMIFIIFLQLNFS